MELYTVEIEFADESTGYFEHVEKNLVDFLVESFFIDDASMIPLTIKITKE